MSYAYQVQYRTKERDNNEYSVKEIQIYFEDNTSIVALIRQNSPLSEILNIHAHNSVLRSDNSNGDSGDSAHGFGGGGYSSATLFSFLLVKPKDNITVDLKMINEITTNNLDCIMVGYGLDGFHPDDFIKFIKYIGAINNNWKWEDRPQLLFMRAIVPYLAYDDTYKLLPSPIVVIYTKDSIDIGFSHSLSDLFYKIVPLINNSTNIDAFFNKLKRDYDFCKTKYAVRNKGMTLLMASGAVATIIDVTVKLAELIK